MDPIVGALDAASSFNNFVRGAGEIAGLVDGVNGNQVSQAPLLTGELGDHGGPVRTLRLLPGSPALNAGTNADADVPATDARGLGRVGAPDIGAFGVVTVLLVLVARVGALATLAPDPLLVAGLWAGARAGMALTMALMPYARVTGAASGFADRRTAPAAASLVVALALVVATLGGWAGPATAAALVVGFAAVVGAAIRRLGGYTGDVLGAAGVVAETVALMVAAARW